MDTDSWKVKKPKNNSKIRIKRVPIKIPLTKQFFNPNKTFYVCSYGGCGSTILSRYLECFGNVEHIHSRFPPDKLTYVGKKNTTEDIYREWFNNSVIPEEKLINYKVIFIYRNPVDSILSRFYKKNHLEHVQCKNTDITIKEVVQKKKDMYDLKEFFKNYTTIENENRNYIIYCVKYEELFDKFREFNKTMNIPDVKKLYPKKYERKMNPKNKNQEVVYKHIRNTLGEIYKDTIDEMEQMPFIKIV